MGLGICKIAEEVRKLTNKPIIAVATHFQWDHVGGHKYYLDVYIHEAELNWLNGGFPLSIETIRKMILDRGVLPEGFDINAYELFFEGSNAVAA